jgi:hypothetical protein
LLQLQPPHATLPLLLLLPWSSSAAAAAAQYFHWRVSGNTEPC